MIALKEDPTVEDSYATRQRGLYSFDFRDPNTNDGIILRVDTVNGLLISERYNAGEPINKPTKLSIR